MNPLAIVTQGLAAPIPLQPMLIGVQGLQPTGAPPDPGPGTDLPARAGFIVNMGRLMGR